MTKEERNKLARKIFNERYPSRTRLAEMIGVYASDLSNFYNGHKDVGGKTLERIEDFLKIKYKAENGSH